MRNGFIFKDRHSSDFGVTVRTKSRPILPSVKENIVDLPYRDGGYDFQKLILSDVSFIMTGYSRLRLTYMPIILRKYRGSCLCFLCGFAVRVS